MKKKGRHSGIAFRIPKKLFNLSLTVFILCRAEIIIIGAQKCRNGSFLCRFLRGLCTVLILPVKYDTPNNSHALIKKEF